MCLSIDTLPQNISHIFLYLIITQLTDSPSGRHHFILVKEDLIEVQL